MFACDKIEATLCCSGDEVSRHTGAIQEARLPLREPGDSFVLSSLYNATRENLAF